MINILILSHCQLTRELIKTAEVIAGKQENLFYIDQDIKSENLASALLSASCEISNGFKKYPEPGSKMLNTSKSR